MVRCSFASLFATLAATCFFFVDTQAAVISHSTVPVWAEPTPADTTQYLAVRFKPVLDVVNGCQPYPAVDSAGNTSGGLNPSGSSSGSCSDKTKAQIYARSGSYNGAYAIMYAWYMPKDEPSPYFGHRHDWENIVVWLDSTNAATAKVVAAAASAHGEYQKSYPISSSYMAANGLSAKINYKATWPLNHQLAFTTTTGATQPLIQWEQMTTAAKNALESTDFGSATVPFKSNFQTYLANAYYK